VFQTVATRQGEAASLPPTRAALYRAAAPLRESAKPGVAAG
jgi:hypothetical protein